MLSCAAADLFPNNRLTNMTTHYHHPPTNTQVSETSYFKCSNPTCAAVTFFRHTALEVISIMYKSQLDKYIYEKDMTKKVDI